jgi:hypothetical protein
MMAMAAGQFNLQLVGLLSRLVLAVRSPTIATLAVEAAAAAWNTQARAKAVAEQAEEQADMVAVHLTQAVQAVQLVLLAETAQQIQPNLAQCMAVAVAAVVFSPEVVEAAGAKTLWHMVAALAVELRVTQGVVQVELVALLEMRVRRTAEDRAVAAAAVGGLVAEQAEQAEVLPVVKLSLLTVLQQHVLAQVQLTAQSHKEKYDHKVCNSQSTRWKLCF